MTQFPDMPGINCVLTFLCLDMYEKSDIVYRPDLYNLQTKTQGLGKNREVGNELSKNDGTRCPQILCHCPGMSEVKSWNLLT